MTRAAVPALVGGQPLRDTALAYGRHDMEDVEADAVAEVLMRGTLTGGPEIARFEAALAERCGVAFAVVVTNGTAALHLALCALEIKPGDEVITTPLTFVATANAIVYTGAKPIFADIGEDRCLDPGSVALSMRPATKAIIAVDYSGLPADAPAIAAAARGLPLVIDGAHSLGASLGGHPVGSLGAVTTLSFHPVKHITTGEGGACLTDDRALADRIRRLRNHGMSSDAVGRASGSWKYDVVDLGNNYRMTGFQAELGRLQLRRLDAKLERRRELADRYDGLLDGIPGLSLPPRPPGRTSAWHIYSVEIDAARFGWARDEVIDGLRAENIQATLHYPAVHTLSLYRDRGYHRGIAPVAEATCERLVTLPLFPTMTGDDQDDVVAALRRLAMWRT